MTTRFYSVLRYLTNPIRGEFRNIGVALVDPVANRFEVKIGEPGELPLAIADREEAGRLARAAWWRAKSFDIKEFEHLAGKEAGRIRFSPPLGASRRPDFDVLLAKSFAELVAVPQRERRVRGPRLHAQVNRAMKPLVAERKVVTDFPVDDLPRPEIYEFAYLNGCIHVVRAKALPAERPQDAVYALAQEAKLLAELPPLHDFARKLTVVLRSDDNELRALAKHQIGERGTVVFDEQLDAFATSVRQEAHDAEQLAAWSAATIAPLRPSRRQRVLAG